MKNPDEIKKRLLDKRMLRMVDMMENHYCQDMSAREKNSFIDFMVKHVNGAFRLGVLSTKKV